jgi:predicted nucleic acid-binding protein
MKRSILDSDTISNLMRGNQKVRIKIDEHIQIFGSINISVVTYYEILNGLFYKDAKKQLAIFERFASSNNVIPLTIASAKIAASIEADLRKNGKIIGHTDTLIAGTAVANELQLITNNTDHFKRVKGLDLANWVK